MATLTPMIADGNTDGTSITGDWSRYVRGASTWSEFVTVQAADYPQSLDEAITASEALNDTGIGGASGYNAASTVNVELTETDADFQSMLTLAIRYSTHDFSSYADDEGSFAVRIYASGASPLLAAYSSGGISMFLDAFDGTNWTGTGSRTVGGVAGNGGSATAPAYDKTVTFPYVNTTATKAQWDNGAYIQLLTGDAKTKGSDGAAIVLVDFELTGTYTPEPLRPQTTQGYGGRWDKSRRPMHVGALY